MTLPTNYYTQWYWKVDLNNLFHFLSLRADAHAQYEIRVYAEEICRIVERWCPMAYEAFKDYRMTGTAVSGPGMAVIKRLLAGESVTQENSGLGKREWTELMATLGR
jgi:thymidylate synthase (FAD)